jgi:hypothetical protein
MPRSFVLSELRRILHIDQNRVEMCWSRPNPSRKTLWASRAETRIVGASIRPAAGGRGHRISEKFGYLSEPLLFVFWELQDVLFHEFGDLIWHVQR